MKNIDFILEQAKQTLDTHRLETPGAYKCWLWQDKTVSRMLGINEYGCADAANILYMIGEFPGQPDERKSWVDTLQSFQSPNSGLFQEITHHPFHTTAHCIAALELFEEKALCPLKEMQPFLDKNRLYDLLNSLDWENNPWTASHQGAGIFAALVLQGEADAGWQKWYFDWFYEEADPETGFWKKGVVKPILNGDSFSGTRKTPSVFPHLASSFHYLFNHEYAHMPLRYPEKMVDTCLDIYQNNRWETLGKSISFAEIDWVYCLNRSLRQCRHRFDEGKSALSRFAADYISYLEGLDHKSHDGFQDLHTLFGCICALSELQAALPGEIHSNKPLKLVLDRRPFI